MQWRGMTLRKAAKNQTLLICSYWKQQLVHDGCHLPAPQSHDPQRSFLPCLDPHFLWEVDTGDAQPQDDP